MPAMTPPSTLTSATRGRLRSRRSPSRRGSASAAVGGARHRRSIAHSVRGRDAGGLPAASATGEPSAAGSSQSSASPGLKPLAFDGAAAAAGHQTTTTQRTSGITCIRSQQRDGHPLPDAASMPTQAAIARETASDNHDHEQRPSTRPPQDVRIPSSSPGSGHLPGVANRHRAPSRARSSATRAVGARVVYRQRRPGTRSRCRRSSGRGGSRRGGDSAPPASRPTGRCRMAPACRREARSSPAGA